jgi:hypothetical protein
MVFRMSVPPSCVFFPKVEEICCGKELGGIPVCSWQRMWTGSQGATWVSWPLLARIPNLLPRRDQKNQGTCPPMLLCMPVWGPRDLLEVFCSLWLVVLTHKQLKLQCGKPRERNDSVGWWYQAWSLLGASACFDFSEASSAKSYCN